MPRTTEPTRRRTRRQLVGETVATAGALLVGGAQAAEEPPWDPFAPVAHYPALRRRFTDPRALRAATGVWWRRHRQSARLSDAERALALTYAWWRAETRRKGRLEAIRVGIELSERLRDHPSAVGPTWTGVFWGCRGLQIGVLSALKRAPEILRHLETAIARDPGYWYGMPHFVLGKLYTKLPPFPMAFGDLRKGEEHLRAAEPYARGRYANWYLFLAENLHLHRRHDEMTAFLHAISEVEPPNAYCAYILESTRADVAEFERVVTSGEYDKYTWDPLLHPVRLS